MNTPAQTPESTVIGAYFRADDGCWYLTESAKAEATAMYFSGRIAYSPEDSTRAIGRYSPTGEIVPYAWHESSSATEGQ